MKEYARFDHIRELRADVIPKVDHFTNLLDKYTNDNVEMKECILKFDNRLCLKSSKAEILKMKE